MKITRILFTIIFLMIYSTASAEIDVDVLTRGGWNFGAECCYFFKADGTGNVVGSNIVPIKWTAEVDVSLKLTDAEGITKRLEIKGATMHLSDGREGFHRPFAEEEIEISLRRGRKYADLTWHAPHSANTLSDMLHKKKWICDMPGASITFYSADTCIVSDFKRQNLNQWYLWQALDAENIKLTALTPPYGTKVVKIKMRPSGFDLIDNGETGRYRLNAYYIMDAIGATFDMCCFPLGCYFFFNGREDEVKEYINQTFPDPEGVTDFSVYIVGFLWTCDGVILTPDDRRVSYVNYSGDDATVDKSFEYMTIVLNNLFPPADSQQGENTRVFIDESPGGNDPLIITLLKKHSSGNSNGSNGFVSLAIHNKN